MTILDILSIVVSPMCKEYELPTTFDTVTPIILPSLFLAKDIVILDGVPLSIDDPK